MNERVKVRKPINPESVVNRDRFLIARKSTDGTIQAIESQPTFERAAYAEHVLGRQEDRAKSAGSLTTGKIVIIDIIVVDWTN